MSLCFYRKALSADAKRLTKRHTASRLISVEEGVWRQCWPFVAVRGEDRRGDSLRSL